VPRVLVKVLADSQSFFEFALPFVIPLQRHKHSAKTMVYRCNVDVKAGAVRDFKLAERLLQQYFGVAKTSSTKRHATQLLEGGSMCRPLTLL
jgi:hypothetical protein